MGYHRQTALPVSEPISLAEAKTRLRIDSGDGSQDAVITGLIQAAREVAESVTGLSLAQRSWTLALDSFPYFTDSAHSQSAYPPNYYAQAQFSTTLWNYSQQIKLQASPVVSVTGLRYVDTSGAVQTLHQDTDFILDRISEPARIFPQAGQFWPTCLYVPNAVQIDYITGYDPDPTATDTHTVSGANPQQQTPSTIVTGIPQSLRDGMLAWIQLRFDNPGQPVPVDTLYALFGHSVAWDFSPTH